MADRASLDLARGDVGTFELILEEAVICEVKKGKGVLETEAGTHMKVEGVNVY